MFLSGAKYKSMIKWSYDLRLHICNFLQQIKEGASMAKDQYESEKWHLKKEVNIVHIFATFSIIAAVFSWSGSVETRLAVLENNSQIFIKQTDEIKNSLVRIEQKIDRKADK